MRGGILGRRVGLLMGGLVVRAWAVAQTADANQGLDEANTLIRGYYTSATNLMFAIGAILGIIGAIRVAVMWFNGEPHMGKVAAMWFGACIFLVVVATVIKSFFGL